MVCSSPSHASARWPPERQAQRQGQQAQQQSQQAPPQQEQAEQPEIIQGPEPRPDLRIVSLSVAPDPPRAGAPLSVTLLVHNDSMVPATGNIGVQVVHDGGTPLPRPAFRTTLSLEGDELEELEFTVDGMTIEDSPYRFFAAIDVFDEIEEENEANNVVWRRLRVCEDPEAAEVADGRDNDCDGLIDEGLGLPADPGETLRMLRELQRRAAEDSVPLVWGLASTFAPFATERVVSLRAIRGQYIRASDLPGDDVRADRDSAGEHERFTLVDWNGGELENGDIVSLRTSAGSFLVAEGGGGAGFGTASLYHERERLFTVVKMPAPDAAATTEAQPDEAEAVSAATIRSGDSVALVTNAGYFVTAEQGGGGELNADRVAIGGWQMFTLIFDEEEERS